MLLPAGLLVLCLAGSAHGRPLAGPPVTFTVFLTGTLYESRQDQTDRDVGGCHATTKGEGALSIAFRSTRATRVVVRRGPDGHVEYARHALTRVAGEVARGGGIWETSCPGGTTHTDCISGRLPFSGARTSFALGAAGDIVFDQLAHRSLPLGASCPAFPAVPPLGLPLAAGHVSPAALFRQRVTIVRGSAELQQPVAVPDGTGVLTQRVAWTMRLTRRR